MHENTREVKRELLSWSEDELRAKLVWQHSRPPGHRYVY